MSTLEMLAKMHIKREKKLYNISKYENELDMDTAQQYNRINPKRENRQKYENVSTRNLSLEIPVGKEVENHESCVVTKFQANAGRTIWTSDLEESYDLFAPASGNRLVCGFCLPADGRPDPGF